MHRWVAIVMCACSQRSVPPTPIAPSDASQMAPASIDAPLDAPPVATTIDPDGDDDPVDPGTGTVPATARWIKVGTPPLALTRICDLTPLGDALYMAHARQPLGSDGATITRYRPTDAKPFSVAFDWNRRGEPTRGGGAGQGFLRVHAIDGRLHVADADPPYNGLGIVGRAPKATCSCPMLRVCSLHRARAPGRPRLLASCRGRITCST
jgi:hypothetical protein